MYTIERIQDIDSVWDTAKPLIEKALSKSEGEMAIQDVYQRLQDESYWLLMITGPATAAAVINLVDYPQKMVLRYMYLGGEKMIDWLPALDQWVTQLAEATNIDGIEIIGRKGWERKMIPFGYEPKYIHLIKKVNHG